MKIRIQKRILTNEGAFTPAEEVGFFEGKVAGEINIFANGLNSRFTKETDNIKELKARVVWLKKVRNTIAKLEREHDKLFF